MRKILNKFKLVTIVGTLAATMVVGVQTVSAQASGGPGPQAACKAGKIVRTSGGPGPQAVCKAGKIRPLASGGPGPQ